MDKINRMPKGEGGKETPKERMMNEKKSDNTCSKCGGKHMTSAHGAKGEAMKRAKK